MNCHNDEFSGWKKHLYSSELWPCHWHEYQSLTRINHLKKKKNNKTCLWMTKARFIVRPNFFFFFTKREAVVFINLFSHFLVLFFNKKDSKIVHWNFLYQIILSIYFLCEKRKKKMSKKIHLSLPKFNFVDTASKKYTKCVSQCVFLIEIPFFISTIFSSLNTRMIFLEFYKQVTAAYLGYLNIIFHLQTFFSFYE